VSGRQRAKRIGLGAAAGVAYAVYGLGVALFIALIAGGGVYRTECDLNGQRVTSWGLEGAIPYLWDPGDKRCEAHTLTRYVLGKTGLMSDVAE
jgi:hypothetical protein